VARHQQPPRRVHGQRRHRVPLEKTKRY
jgi:hypothetical protein